MKICPCCGFKSANSETAVLGEPCLSCGAHAVGEPLPRPAHELPSYARSLVLTVMGTLMVLVFLTQTILAAVERSARGAKSSLAALSMISFDWRLWLAASETVAWRLKWVMIPVTLLVIFASRKIYRSMQAEPSRFCGQRYALRGYVASVAVPLVILILIGVTVPERLHQRSDALEASILAQGHAWDRLFLQYREKFGTFPSEKNDLARLPDPDGSIAALLKEGGASDYKPGAEVAVVPTQNPRPLGGAVIRNASLNTAADDSLGEGLSLTNYELRLPGPDNILNNEDDLIVIDGVTWKPSELPRRGVNATSAAKKLQR